MSRGRSGSAASSSPGRRARVRATSRSAVTRNTRSPIRTPCRLLMFRKRLRLIDKDRGLTALRIGVRQYLPQTAGEFVAIGEAGQSVRDCLQHVLAGERMVLAQGDDDPVDAAVGVAMRPGAEDRSPGFAAGIVVQRAIMLDILAGQSQPLHLFQGFGARPYRAHHGDNRPATSPGTRMPQSRAGWRRCNAGRGRTGPLRRGSRAGTARANRLADPIRNSCSTAPVACGMARHSTDYSATAQVNGSLIFHRSLPGNS